MTPPLTTSASSGRRWAAALLPPLAVALLVRAVFMFAAIDAVHFKSLTADWVKWDAAHYLSITQHGYDFHRDPQHPLTSNQAWAGDTSWLPGYPLALRPLLRLHMPPAPAALVLSGIEHFILLILIWKLVRQIKPTDGHPWAFAHDDPSSQYVTLILAGFFPAAIFLITPFPMSQAAMFIAAQVLLVYADRPILAGLAGAAAAFSHPSAAFVAAWPLATALFPARDRRARFDLLLTTAISLAGFAAVLLYDRVAVGVWDAFFKTQRSFGTTFTTPWQTLRIALFSAEQANRRFRPPGIAAFLLVILFIAMLIQPIRRKLAGTYDGALLPLATIAALVPACMNILSPYRSQLLMIVAVPLLADLPKRSKIILLLASTYVSYEMAVAYFKGDLF